MEFFQSSVYWNFNLILLWLDLALVIYFIGKEIFEKIRENKKLAVFLLIIPLMAVLPIGPKYFNNAFMHESLAREISENRLAETHCIWFSGNDCNMMSFPPWTYAYHVMLSQFVSFGFFGIKLLNAVLIFIFFFFGYLALEKKSVSNLLSLALPQMLVLAATPNLDVASLAVGMVFLYFANANRKWESAALGAYLIHLRPENIIYVALMGLPVFKEWLKDKKVLGFVGVNLLLKILEYFRGREFTAEWTLNLQTRLQMLPNLVPNLAYVFSPARFNLVFSVLVLVGVFKLIKKKKFGAAVLPLLAMLIYTTHPHVVFTGQIESERYLLGWAFASLPAFLEGLKGRKLPAVLILLAVVPFVFTDFSENVAFQNYELAQVYRTELAEISNVNAMPIYSFTPWVFEGGADAVFIVDDFPYPAGGYLYFSTENQTLPFASYMKHINGELFLYNISRVS